MQRAKPFIASATTAPLSRALHSTAVRRAASIRSIPGVNRSSILRLSRQPVRPLFTGSGANASSIARRCFATDAAPEAGAATEKPAAEATAAAAAKEGGDATAAIEKKLADSEKAVAEQKKKLEEAEKKYKELNNEYLRTHAEMQNVRRIARSDVQNANKYALQSIGKKLLAVLDNMQRGRQSVKGLFEADGSTPTAAGSLVDSEAMLRSLYEGVVLTEKGMTKALTENGFKKIESMGQKVDPNLHNVLYSVEDASKKAGTITQVLEDGWMLHERVIRPADVAIVKASKPAPAAAPPAADAPKTDA